LALSCLITRRVLTMLMILSQQTAHLIVLPTCLSAVLDRRFRSLFGRREFIELIQPVLRDRSLQKPSGDKMYSTAAPTPYSKPGFWIMNKHAFFACTIVGR
jgi:hypothetical protein